MSTPSNTPTPRRVGTAELLTRLGVSRMTLDRWIKASTFPRPHFLGSRRSWFVAEVEAWEASRMAELADPANRPGGAKNLRAPAAA